MKGPSRMKMAGREKRVAWSLFAVVVTQCLCDLTLDIVHDPLILRPPLSARFSTPNAQ